MDAFSPARCGLIVALALAALTTRAGASPIQYSFTHLGGSTWGHGLTNDGKVVWDPVRTVVGHMRLYEYVPYPGATTTRVIDGAADGRLLLEAYGKNAPTRYFIYDPRPGFSSGTFSTIGEGNSLDVLKVLDMNARGDVVGMALYDTPNWFPILYLGDTHEVLDIRDFLPTDLGWKFISVDAINDSGQVLGHAQGPWGEQFNFLLTPDVVPEPTTLTLGALVLVVTGLRHIRKRLGHGR